MDNGVSRPRSAVRPRVARNTFARQGPEVLRGDWHQQHVLQRLPIRAA